MYLGREVIGADQMPVYVMPKMKRYLTNNGTWSQLIDLNNIELMTLNNRSVVELSNLQVTPFIVPHRDEFSETVGFSIKGPNKTALFIPDINKWSQWERDIADQVQASDYALIDATFFNNG